MGAAPRVWASHSQASPASGPQRPPRCRDARHSPLYAKVFRASKLLVANDRHQFNHILQRTRALGLEMTVTEIIPGPDTRLSSRPCASKRGG